MIKDGIEKYNKYNANLRIRIDKLFRKPVCTDNKLSHIGKARRKKQKALDLE